MELQKFQSEFSYLLTVGIPYCVCVRISILNLFSTVLVWRIHQYVSLHVSDAFTFSFQYTILEYYWIDSECKHPPLVLQFCYSVLEMESLSTSYLEIYMVCDNLQVGQCGMEESLGYIYRGWGCKSGEGDMEEDAALLTWPSWRSNPWVWTLFEWNQWLKNWYLSLPSPVHSIIG